MADYEKIKGLIGIARKAGFVVVGQDELLGYDKKLFLLLIDKKAGNSLCREINFLSAKRDLKLLQIEDLDKLVSIQNCKVVGIRNKAMSDSILKFLEIDNK